MVIINNELKVRGEQGRLTPYEHWLRGAFIAIAQHRGVEDMFKAWVTHSGVDGVHKAKKFHLKSIITNGFLMWTTSQLKPILRYKRINRYKHDTFHFEEVQIDGNGYYMDIDDTTTNAYTYANINESRQYDNSSTNGMSSPMPIPSSNSRITVAVGGKMVKGASNLISIIGGASAGIASGSGASASSRLGGGIGGRIEPSALGFVGTPNQRVQKGEREKGSSVSLKGGKHVHPGPPAGTNTSTGSYDNSNNNSNSNSPASPRARGMQSPAGASYSSYGSYGNYGKSMNSRNSPRNRDSFGLGNRYNGSKEVLGVSLHHHKLSSAKFYTIALIGTHPVHMHNQDLLALLFSLRRLHKRTVRHRQHRQLRETTQKHLVRRVFKNVLKVSFQQMTQDKSEKLLLADQHFEDFEMHTFKVAWHRMKIYPHLMALERQGLTSMRIRIESVGKSGMAMALRAIHLIRCACMVKFFLAIKENYHHSEITKDEIMLTQAFQKRFYKQMGLKKWISWKRAMSFQRLNEKNFRLYRFTVLRNRIQRQRLENQHIRYSGHSLAWIEAHTHARHRLCWNSYDAYVRDFSTDYTKAGEERRSGNSTSTISHQSQARFMKAGEEGQGQGQGQEPDTIGVSVSSSWSAYPSAPRVAPGEIMQVR